MASGALRDEDGNLGEQVWNTRCGVPRELDVEPTVQLEARWANERFRPVEKAVVPRRIEVEDVAAVGRRDLTTIKHAIEECVIGIVTCEANRVRQVERLARSEHLA